MAPRSPRRVARRPLPAISAALGVLLGVGLLLPTFTYVAPDGRVYWTTSVAVPADATAAHPFHGNFRGASYSVWWPPPPPPGSISTGLQGVSIRITEPSGFVDSTSTGCGGCGGGPQYWYSGDGSVGIIYPDGSFGDLTVLVAA